MQQGQDDLDDDMGAPQESKADAPPLPQASLPSPPPAVKKVASIFSKPTTTAKAAAASPSNGVLNKSQPSSSSKKKPSKAPTSAKQTDKEDEEDEDDLDEEEEEEEAGPSDKRKKKKASSSKGQGSKVEGVGHGAIAAASKLAEADVSSLVGGKWKEGEAVPFEFLADTFEEIAGTTKRLEIVHLLVRLVTCTCSPQ